VVVAQGGEEEEEDIFQVGDLIDDKYKVNEKLGRGGYGEIYACKYTKSGESVAVKVERVTKPGNLKEEETILRSLKECKYAPQLLNSGRHEDRVNYIVMNLLGENLSNLRRKQTSHRFSLQCTLMLGMQMLRALKEIHDMGYIHRDIKPGNFVMGGQGNRRTVILIDYGLSRRYRATDGTIKPKRSNVRWVGSRRYMSLNTHFRKEQGRRDDLWSLLYVLLEFLNGTLPWAHLRGIVNLDKVQEMKIQYNNEKLVRGVPEEFMKFMNHLKTLKYETRPDYEFLHSLLKSLLERNGGLTIPFDWETPDEVTANNFDMDIEEGIGGASRDKDSPSKGTDESSSSSSSSSKARIIKMTQGTESNGEMSSE